MSEKTKSRTVLIYRVENKEKRGPYCSGECARVSTNLYDNRKCPTPCNINREIIRDGLNLDDFYFGFKTLKQLQSWFTIEARIEMKEFYVAVYKVNRKYCYFDHRQATFWRDKASFQYSLDLRGLKKCPPA